MEWTVMLEHIERQFLFLDNITYRTDENRKL